MTSQPRDDDGDIAGGAAPMMDIEAVTAVCEGYFALDRWGWWRVRYSNTRVDVEPGPFAAPPWRECVVLPAGPPFFIAGDEMRGVGGRWVTPSEASVSTITNGEGGHEGISAASPEQLNWVLESTCPLPTEAVAQYAHRVDLRTLYGAIDGALSAAEAHLAGLPRAAVTEALDRCQDHLARVMVGIGV